MSWFSLWTIVVLFHQGSTLPFTCSPRLWIYNVSKLISDNIGANSRSLLDAQAMIRTKFWYLIDWTNKSSIVGQCTTKLFNCLIGRFGKSKRSILALLGFETTKTKYRNYILNFSSHFHNTQNSIDSGEMTRNNKSPSTWFILLLVT